MSPVSRGRKTKKSRPKGAPTLDTVHAEMLRVFQQVVDEGDPIEVEMLVSDTVGSWWQALSPDADPDKIVGLSAVEYAMKRATPAAQALLRSFAAVAGSAELREAAAAGATALAAQGVPDPPWAASIGRVEVGPCWRFGDVFGDQASLYCEFSYGSERHVLAALLEFDPIGWVKDVWVGDDLEAILAEVREQVAEEPDLTVLEPIEPAVARALLEEGLEETDAIWQPEVADTFREFRGLALARCRALPGPAELPEPAEVSEKERAELVEEFLGGAALPDDATTRACARLIVDLGADYDEGRPLRISPLKIEMLVHDWLPEEELDEDVIDAMPAVLVAWIRWAGARSQLPAAAIDHVVEVTEECVAHLDEAYEEGGLDDLYLADVETDDPQQVQAILERRLFAVPETSAELGEDSYPELDPTDSDELAILIEAEHTEWQELLEDSSFDGEVDGVNPRLHLAMHAVVVNQLWNDEPPEAWQAAQRMGRSGTDRHEILHELMRVASEHLHHTLTTGQPADLQAYAKALDGLGRSRVRKLR